MLKSSALARETCISGGAIIPRSSQQKSNSDMQVGLVLPRALVVFDGLLFLLRKVLEKFYRRHMAAPQREDDTLKSI